MSVDVGLRLEWTLTLSLWDILIEELESTDSGRVVGKKGQNTQNTSGRNNRFVDTPEYNPSNAHVSSQWVFFFFGDNEAVIKMIKKDRSQIRNARFQKSQT